MTRRGLAYGTFAGALFVLAQSSPAGAFCRAKACDTDPSYGDAWDEGPQPTECVRNAQGCFTQGTPLFWASGCIPYSVQKDGSASSEIDADAARDVIQDAFDNWAAADCGGETPSVRAVHVGEVACDQAEYNEHGPNANVFVFREDDWPYVNIPHAIALTTISYNVESAEIYDVDVEFNSVHNRFTITDEPLEIAADFSSVVTHEVGHVLGLSHSEVNTAVMRATGYSGGTTELRVLTQDDIDGVCEAFPPGSVPTSRCDVRHGFSDGECGGRPRPDEGCHAAPRRPDPAGGFFALFATLGLALAHLRRRRTPSRETASVNHAAAIGKPQSREGRKVSPSGF